MEINGICSKFLEITRLSDPNASLNFSSKKSSQVHQSNPDHLVNTSLLPLPRQRLKYPRRQLVPNQPSKHHQIFGLLQQAIRNRPRLRIIKGPRQQILAVMRATRDTPEQHVSNIPRNFRRVLAEAVGRGADDAQIAASGEGKDVGFLEALKEC
jgi:hypothetical protein